MRKYVSLVASAIFVLIFLSNCKKTDTTNNNGAGSPLVDESTGWRRVATIQNTYNYVDQNTTCRMQGYDLALTGNNLNVLYSEDKFENGQYQSQFLKGTYTLGSSTSPVISVLPGEPYLPNNPNLVFRPVLNRVSLKMETMCFWHNYSDPYTYLELYDQSMVKFTTQNPFCDPTLTAKMLDNGDVMAGVINFSGNICELDYYKRSTGTWHYINQSAGDTQWPFAYTPFRLDDGTVLAYRMYSLNNKAFLSIADFVDHVSFPAAPYSARFTEEHTEYAPTGMNGVHPVYAADVSVCAYNISGNSFTVVLLEKNKITLAYSLSAYNWTAGATAFTQLYKNIPISADLAQVITLHQDQVGCNMDGTAYAIVLSGYNYHLALVTAAGESSHGLVSNGNGGRYVAFFSSLRYYGGSYYAIVAPFFAGTDYIGQHLDVVKLTL